MTGSPWGSKAGAEAASRPDSPRGPGCRPLRKTGSSSPPPRSRSPSQSRHRRLPPGPRPARRTLHLFQGHFPRLLCRDEASAWVPDGSWRHLDGLPSRGRDTLPIGPSRSLLYLRPPMTLPPLNTPRGHTVLTKLPAGTRGYPKKSPQAPHSRLRVWAPPSPFAGMDGPATSRGASGSARRPRRPRRAHAPTPKPVSQRPRRGRPDARPPSRRERARGREGGACAGRGRACACAGRAAARAERGDGGGGAESVSSRPGAAGPGSIPRED